MPDITMCINSSCSIREDCYRYVAHPSEWQSFAHYRPNVGLMGTDSAVTCDHFMEVWGKDSRFRSVEEVDKKYNAWKAGSSFSTDSSKRKTNYDAHTDQE